MPERKWTKMASIARTFQRAEAEGLGISQHMIRQLCISGEINPVVVGKRTYLVNWDNLLNYLETGSVKSKKETPDDGKIHRIEVR